MNLIDRVKNILITPQKEWDVINNEPPNTSGIITGYVLPLAGAAAVAAFIGYAFVGVNLFGFRIKGMDWGLYHGLSVLLSALLIVLICSFIIDALAPSFGSEKNMGRSVQLAAYSLTPLWVGGLLAIIPALGVVGIIAAIYGLYLLYIGLPKLKKTPQDKQVAYYVISLITIIVVYLVVGYIIGRILISIFGIAYPTAGDFRL